jgi:hypothetical protein
VCSIDVSRVFWDASTVAFFCVSCARSCSILEECSWVRSDEAIVGLMVIGWVVWVVSEEQRVVV